MPRLLSIVADLLPKIAPEQTRYRVTTIPTERTVRFYTAQGVVDNPLGMSGRSALYGYRHLLQILAVKYLQSHDLPLRKVRSMVAGASNRELEQLFPEIAPAGWSHLTLTRASAPSPAADRGGSAVPPAPSGPASAEADPAPVDLDAWHRVEVGPGIELHVHAAALGAQERERLRGALLRELAALRGWFPAGTGKG